MPARAVNAHLVLLWRAAMPMCECGQRKTSQERQKRRGVEALGEQKRHRLPANSGLHNVHPTLCSEADSRAPRRELTVHGETDRVSRHQ